MQPHDYPAIENLISSARLKSYQVLANDRSLEQCIGAYVWNKRVGAALFPLLQCLEVTLRNAVHNAASVHFNAPDWFDPLTKLAGHDYYKAFMKKNPSKASAFYRKGVTTGVKNNRPLWVSRHESMVSQAKSKLSGVGKPLDANAIVAELMFGFWLGMFEKNYNDFSVNNRLWPHLDSLVFPNMASSARRHTAVHAKLYPIKDLRNRVAHHEPIWKHASVSNASTAVKLLKNSIDDAVLLISGISTERAQLLHESGIEGMARAICRQDVLEFYLKGRVSREVSVRRLKRDLNRHIDGKNLFPTSFAHAGKETVFLNICI